MSNSAKKHKRQGDAKRNPRRRNLRLHLLRRSHLYRQFKAMAKARGLELSKHADRLILVSAEAWVAELQAVPSNPYYKASMDPTIVNRIMSMALEDPHVAHDMKVAGRVFYPSLLVALSTAGVKVLRPLLEKGF